MSHKIIQSVIAQGYVIQRTKKNPGGVSFWEAICYASNRHEADLKLAEKRGEDSSGKYVFCAVPCIPEKVIDEAKKEVIMEFNRITRLIGPVFRSPRIEAQ